MILISHRGNLTGPDRSRENSPEYITEALMAGFHVEVDVWYTDYEFWLGHDFPQFKINYRFLINEKLWCHAKNLDALFEMKKYTIHYFWHESDTITLTSKNYVWAYPTPTPILNSINLLPEIHNTPIQGCRGVCSDFILNYRS